MKFAERLSRLMSSHDTSIAELSRVVGVTRQSVMRWLEGSMPSADKMTKIAEYYNVDIAELTNGRTITTDGDLVPVIGYIRAGYPVESFENIEDYVKAPTGIRYSDEMFALKVVGDSMMPIVMEGDIVICQKGLRADGRICVVTVDNESTLKKIRIDPHGKSITLIPTNPMYPEIHYTASEANEKHITIDGVLVQMIRNF